MAAVSLLSHLAVGPRRVSRSKSTAQSGIEGLSASGYVNLNIHVEAGSSVKIFDLSEPGAPGQGAPERIRPTWTRLLSGRGLWRLGRAARPMWPSSPGSEEASATMRFCRQDAAPRAKLLIFCMFHGFSRAAKRLWRECNALRDTAFAAPIWFQPWRKEGYEQSASRARSTPLQGCAGKPFRGFPAHPQRMWSRGPAFRS